jgi:hypothetical protein
MGDLAHCSKNAGLPALGKFQAVVPIKFGSVCADDSSFILEIQIVVLQPGCVGAHLDNCLRCHSSVRRVLDLYPALVSLVLHDADGCDRVHRLAW